MLPFQPNFLHLLLEKKRMHSSSSAIDQHVAGAIFLPLLVSRSVYASTLVVEQLGTPVKYNQPQIGPSLLVTDDQHGGDQKSCSSFSKLKMNIEELKKEA
ncbi:hypothetical protein Nepgr_031827 [Nepenthes gracilis]|uniref:Uncharacterized protein n=1 Tax=Nepenthes gracilis TaxID=150966 RepID=A0AAD3Y7E9_NEPGR|nr:hypothetical protein Nepgr_031827 [Nepenthes gracilis]